MERDIVDRLRAMAGPIVPNVCTEAADEIERLRKEQDEAPQKVTTDDGRTIRRSLNRIAEHVGEASCVFAPVALVREARDLIKKLERSRDSIYEDLTDAFVQIERLTRERDAFKAQADDVVEVDIDDIERVIKAAKSLGKDSIRLSARDIWRMASDRRGREEEDQPWN